MTKSTLARRAAAKASAIANYELACHRIGATIVLVAMNTAYAAFLVACTGCEFFRGLVPNAYVDWMTSLRLAKLSTLTYYNLSFGVPLVLVLLLFRKSKGR